MAMEGTPIAPAVLNHRSSPVQIPTIAATRVAAARQMKMIRGMGLLMVPSDYSVALMVAHWLGADGLAARRLPDITMSGVETGCWTSPSGHMEEAPTLMRAAGLHSTGFWVRPV